MGSDKYKALTVYIKTRSAAIAAFPADDNDAGESTHIS